MIVEYILQSNLNAGEQPTFTVNTSAAEVDLVNSVNPGYLRNGTGYKFFSANDNIRVLSLGLVFPQSFTLSTQCPRVLPSWSDSLAAFGAVKEFTGSDNGGYLYLPYDGAEFPVDVTIAHKSPGNKVAYAITYPAGLKVSCVNAPSILNGAALTGWFFWKVVHTLPMVAG